MKVGRITGKGKLKLRTVPFNTRKEQLRNNVNECQATSDPTFNFDVASEEQINKKQVILEPPSVAHLFLSQRSDELQVLYLNDKTLVIIAKTMFANGPFFISWCRKCKDQIFAVLYGGTSDIQFDSEKYPLIKCCHINQAVSNILHRIENWNVSVDDTYLQNVLNQELDVPATAEIFTNRDETLKVFVKKHEDILLFTKMSNQNWKCQDCNNTCGKCVHGKRITSTNRSQSNAQKEIQRVSLLIPRPTFSCKFNFNA